jgi:glycosyltransferase involved in cell wall biosynthesis
MTPPRVTVAILSWNRLHYLRATIESARRCLHHPDIEWIVSDNNSVEPGLRDYLDGLDWVDHKWFKTQTHATAMNEIVARASGDYVLIWPEDVQFVVEGNWMIPLLQTLDENPWIGSVGLNFLRKKTLRRLLGPVGFHDAGAIAGDLKRARLRLPRAVGGVRSFGWRLPGVIASGIPSLTRRSVWQELGTWRVSDPTQSNIIDSSLGAEDDMIARFQASGKVWHQATLMKPVSADIINDDQGCKAKIRTGRRYGRYTAPVSGDFYYDILQEADLPGDEGGYPLSFEGFVQPNGFKLPLDAHGDMLKTSIDTSIVSDVDQSF